MQLVFEHVLRSLVSLPLRHAHVFRQILVRRFLKCKLAVAMKCC
jgi:hypothetical protein